MNVKQVEDSSDMDKAQGDFSARSQSKVTADLEHEWESFEKMVGISALQCDHNSTESVDDKTKSDNSESATVTDAGEEFADNKSQSVIDGGRDFMDAPEKAVTTSDVHSSIQDSQGNVAVDSFAKQSKNDQVCAGATTEGDDDDEYELEVNAYGTVIGRIKKQKPIEEVTSEVRAQCSEQSFTDMNIIDTDVSIIAKAHTAATVAAAEISEDKQRSVSDKVKRQSRSSLSDSGESSGSEKKYPVSRPIKDTERKCDKKRHTSSSSDDDEKKDDDGVKRKGHKSTDSPVKKKRRSSSSSSSRSLSRSTDSCNSQPRKSKPASSDSSSDDDDDKGHSSSAKRTSSDKFHKKIDDKTSDSHKKIKEKKVERDNSKDGIKDEERESSQERIRRRLLALAESSLLDVKRSRSRSPEKFRKHSKRTESSAHRSSATGRKQSSDASKDDIKSHHETKSIHRSGSRDRHRRHQDDSEEKNSSRRSDKHLASSSRHKHHSPEKKRKSESPSRKSTRRRSKSRSKERDSKDSRRHHQNKSSKRYERDHRDSRSPTSHRHHRRHRDDDRRHRDSKHHESSRRHRRSRTRSRSRDRPRNFKEQLKAQLLQSTAATAAATSSCTSVSVAPVPGTIVTTLSQAALPSSSMTAAALLASKKPLLGGPVGVPKFDQSTLMHPNEKKSVLPLNNPDPMAIPVGNPGDKVTPQQALMQTMAAMHQKAQEMTGVALPSYYNPAAVNPLKYAEQIKKRKLLWSKAGKEKDGEKEKEDNKVQWATSSFTVDEDGKTGAKFRKLMGIKEEDQMLLSDNVDISKLTAEQKARQEELFAQLDRDYAFARMTTHTHRGVGLGFSSQGMPDT